MTDKLVVSFDFPGVQEGERAVKMLDSMQKVLQTTKGSGKSLEELRRIMVGMKGQASVFEELRDSIKGLGTSLEKIDRTIKGSFKDLSITLKQEMQTLSGVMRMGAAEAGKSFSAGISESFDDAGKVIQAKGKTLAAKARAEATAIYEAMVAKQPNAKIKDMGALFQLSEMGANLSPYHKQVLSNWIKNSNETKRAIDNKVKSDAADLKATIAKEQAALDAWFKAKEQSVGENRAWWSGVLGETSARGKTILNQTKAKIKSEAAELKATVAKEQAALDAWFKAKEQSVTENKAWWSGVLGETSARGKTLLAQTKARIKSEAEELKAAVAKSQEIIRSQVASATNNAQGAYQKYNPKTMQAGAIVDKTKIQEVNAMSVALDKLSISGNNAHSMARGLASGFNLLWLTWGNLAPLFVGAAISNGFMQTAKAGMELEHTLKTIEVLGGNTKQEMAALNAELLNMARTGPFGPLEVAEAMKVLSLAGMKAAEITGTISTVLDFAVAGTTDLKTAADTLVSVTTAFGMGAEGFGYVGDVISKAAAESKTSVESFAGAMKQASVIGAQYGVTLKDTALGIMTLSQLGIEAGAAGTALRNMYADLSGRSMQVSKVLKQQGIELRDLSTGGFRPLLEVVGDLDAKLRTLDAVSQKNLMQALFSERGGKAIVEMLVQIRSAAKDTSSSFSNMLEESRAKLDETAGFMAISAAKMAQSTGEQFKSVGATMKSSMAAAYDEMQPTLYMIAQQMKAVFASPEFITGLTNIVTLVAQFGLALAKLVDFISNNIYVIGALVIGYKALHIALNSSIAATKLKEIADRTSIAATVQNTAAIGAETIAVNANTAAKTRAAGATSTVAGAALGLTRFLPGLGTAIMAVTGAWSLYQMYVGMSSDANKDFANTYNENVAQALADKADKQERINELLKTGLSYELAIAEIEKSKDVGKAMDAETEAYKKWLQKNDEVLRLRKRLDEMGEPTAAQLNRGDPRVRMGVLLDKKIAEHNEAYEAWQKLKKSTEAINKNADRVIAARNEGDRLLEERMRRQMEERNKFGLGEFNLSDATKKGYETPKSLSIYRDTEVANIDKRMNAVQKHLTDGYEAQRAVLERHYSLTLISEEEYQGKMREITEKYEADRVQAYIDAGIERNLAQQKSLDKMIKDNAAILGAGSQTEIAGLRANYSEIQGMLAERQLAYENYWNNIADPTAADQLEQALSSTDGKLEEVIRTMEAMQAKLPSGPLKELSQKFLEAAQSSITFKDTTNNAISGIKLDNLKALDEALKRFSESMGQMIRRNDEFFRRERQSKQREDELEAISRKYEVMNKSIFSTQEAQKAADIAMAESRWKWAEKVEEANLKVLESEKLLAEYRKANAKAIEEGNKSALEGEAERVAARNKAIEEQKRVGTEAGRAAAEAGSDAYAKVMREKGKEMNRGISDAIEAAIFDGTDAGVKKMREFIEQEFLRKPIRVLIEAFVSKVTGTGGGQSGGVGGFGDMVNMFNNVFNKTGTWTNWFGNSFTSESGAGFGTEMGRLIGDFGAAIIEFADTSKYGSETFRKIGEYFVENSADFGQYIEGIGYIINAIKTIEYASEGKWGAAIGTAVGSYFFGPIGGAVGGYLGGWVDNAFGGGYERTTSAGIEGTFSGTSFEGRQYRDWYNQGSLGGSSSSGTNYSDLSNDTKSAMGNAFAAIKAQIAVSAMQLGFESLDLIAGYSKSIRLELMGSAEENKAKVEALFATMADEMANIVLNPEYIRKGERAAEALQRLASSLTAVNITAERLGGTVLALHQYNADAASQLIEMMGGMEKYQSAISNYYSKYYTEEERNAQTLKELTKTFQTMNMVLPDTMDQYRELVNAQDLTTEQGRKNYAALIAMSDAFAEVAKASTSAVVQTTKSLLESAESLKTLASSIASAREGIASNVSQISPSPILTPAQIVAGVAAATPSSSLPNLLATSEALGAASSAKIQAGSNLSAAQKVKGIFDTVMAPVINAQGKFDAASKKLSETPQQIRVHRTYIDGWGIERGHDPWETNPAYAPAKAAYDEAQKLLETAKAEAQTLARTTPELQRYIDAVTGLFDFTATKEAIIADIQTAMTAKADADNVAKLAAQAYAAAVKQYSEDATKAVPILTKLRDETMRYYEAQKQLSEGMLQSAKNLRAAIESIQNAQLTAPQTLSMKQGQFDALYAMATVSSGMTKAGYADQMAALLPDLSSAIKDSSATQLDWILATGQLVAQSSNIASQLEATAPINYAAETLNLLDSIDDTLLNMDSSTQAITRAITATGEVTVEGLRQVVSTLGGTPAFASGGFHTGGLRIVGENGPELEMTGASRILNNGQLRSMMSNGDSDNNAELVAEVRALREDNRAQARAITQLQQRMVKVIERWDNTGLPEERVVT